MKSEEKKEKPVEKKPVEKKPVEKKRILGTAHYMAPEVILGHD